MSAKVLTKAAAKEAKIEVRSAAEYLAEGPAPKRAAPPTHARV